MKKFTLVLIACIAAFTLNAQETKSKIHIKMEKNGVVLKDTVYEVNDDVDPEIVSKILDVTLGDPSGKKQIMTFKSEDGKLHEFHGDPDKILKELDEIEGEQGEHMVITTEEDEEGDTHVIIKKITVKSSEKEESMQEEKNVYIYKGEGKKEVYTIKTNGEKPEWIEGSDHKILIIDGKDGRVKKVKVISEGESDATYETEDGETIIIHTDETDGEKEVKVEVIVEDEKGEKKKISKKKDK